MSTDPRVALDAPETPEEEAARIAEHRHILAAMESAHANLPPMPDPHARQARAEEAAAATLDAILRGGSR